MADFALTPITALWAAYAIGAVGLAFLVLRARPITRGNAILVALLLQQAWQSVASVVRATTTDPNLAWQATLAAIPAWLLWGPVVFLAGPLLLGEAHHAKRLRLIGIAGAAPGLALTASWFVTPSFVLLPDNSGLTELASATLFLVFVGFAFTVAVLLRESLTTPLPIRRAHLGLLAAAFCVEGAYHAAQNSAKALGGGDFFGAAGATPALSALSILPFLAFVAIGIFALVHAQRSRDAPRMKWARIVVAFLGVALLTGFAAAPLVPGDEFTDPLGAIHALWDLSALAFVVYAGLRFQLFRLELQAKGSVAVTAAIAMGFGIWNVTQTLAENYAQDYLRGFDVGGVPASSLLSGLFVGVVAVPLGRSGQKVAIKIFPHVDRTAEYERRRRNEIYLAALEGALADGIETPKEIKTLKMLRAQLGIDEVEHERLEVEVRAKLAAPAATAAPA